MIETTIQATSAPQLANAAFNAIAETLSGAKPALVLMALATRGLETRLGQADPFDARGACPLFVVRRVETSISAEFARGAAEQTPMRFQAGNDLLGIGWIAVQYPILGDETAIDFGAPHLVAELGVVGLGLAPADGISVRLEQTDELVGGWHLGTLQHAPSRLIDDALHQRPIVLHLCLQPDGTEVTRMSQSGTHEVGLLDQRLDYPDQLSIQQEDGSAFVFSRFARRLASQLSDLARQTTPADADLETMPSPLGLAPEPHAPPVAPIDSAPVPHHPTDDCRSGNG